MKDSVNKISFVTVSFFVSLLCVGFFYEYLSCIASAVFAVWLLFNHIKKKQTVVYLNPAFIAVTLTALFYGITVIWATDPGSAFIGFMKYLPVLLFALCFMQKEERAQIIEGLPYAAGIMTVISSLLALIPFLSEYFLTAGRLGGFFQYPNTFAILLLVSELLLLTKKKIRYYDVITIAVLAGGIIYTGSRTVFIIALLANAAAIVFTKSKHFIFYSLLALFGIGFVGLVYYISAGNAGIFSRFFDITIAESTIPVRLLYYVDALPVILKHPFGLGYMGYYYTQGSFQTGIYSSAFIHNDFLQLALDIGWIPALAFVFSIIKSLFSKNTSRRDRIILITLAVHSLIDFDLQFIAIFFLYLLFIGINTGKVIEIKGKPVLVSILSAATLCTSLFVGTSLVLYRSGNVEASYKLYPWNPNTETALLTASDNIEYSKLIADKMTDRNEHALIGWCVKARLAYSQGDFEALIKYKNKIFKIAPYQYDEYEEYARMLINGITVYKEAGDEKSAEMCRKELISIPEKLEALKNRTSKLGYMLNDKPKTELPAVLTDYIEQLSGASE